MNNILDWLMEGDPAIRWQAKRDLLGEPEAAWQAERQRTLEEGWGARFLGLQAEDGSWGGGIYSPKWISTTYTLLTLCHIGIPREHEPARRGARLMLDRLLGKVDDPHFPSNLARMDRCIVGMCLQVGVYFEAGEGRIEAILDNLLRERLSDGAWNCRKGRDPHVEHSSFHTTFNVLEGLRTAIELDGSPQRSQLLEAEGGALEFMLRHRLFKSHHTGEEIEPAFTMLSFPYRWHYDVLRGLEYFARAGAAHDPRLEEAVDLLLRKRLKDGAWPVQHKYSGLVFFNMEKMGAPSRWNTLRALRVLRWWEV
jgi:hypothetical protein